jgi:hypothetical protein
MFFGYLLDEPPGDPAPDLGDPRPAAPPAPSAPTAPRS